MLNYLKIAAFFGIIFSFPTHVYVTPCILTIPAHQSSYRFNFYFWTKIWLIKFEKLVFRKQFLVLAKSVKTVKIFFGSRVTWITGWIIAWQLSNSLFWLNNFVFPVIFVFIISNYLFVLLFLQYLFIIFTVFIILLFDIRYKRIFTLSHSYL